MTPDPVPLTAEAADVHSAAANRIVEALGRVVLGQESALRETVAALLARGHVLLEGVPGTAHDRPESFTVFATQNPIEFEGTYPLPEAELDRFLVKVLIGYPEERVEQGILGRVLGGFEADLPASYGISDVADRAGLRSLRQASRCVRVEPSLVGYITSIVRATGTSPVLTLGASPRGSVALLKMAQASALLEGREFVVPDDVKSLAPAVLRHRVAVAPELELEGITPDAALQGIIEKIEAPRR